jgi:hypothetical protein
MRTRTILGHCSLAAAQLNLSDLQPEDRETLVRTLDEALVTSPAAAR